jgi:CRP-like cAMP-binding protein
MRLLLPGEAAMESEAVLKSVPFFGAVLDNAGIVVVADRSQLRDFARNAVMMRQGDFGQCMFVIISGKASVKVHAPGGAHDVATLGPGDIVGEISLLTGATRNATVTALKSVSALEIGKSALEELMTRNPTLVQRFAGVVEQRSAELRRIKADAARWERDLPSRDELVARMTAHFFG